MNRVWIGAMLAAGTMASAAFAQERIAWSTGAQTIEFIAGEPNVGPIVTGAPYSGEATTTVTQVLADGTRIERSSLVRMFRDRDGRVRREQTVQGLGPLNPSGETIVITIVDPVAGVNYVLDPVSRKARRSSMDMARTKRQLEERQQEERQRRERGGQPPEPPPAPLPRTSAPPDPLAPPPPPPPPAPGEVRARTGNANVANAPQPLGTRQIEGVDAVGTRRVEVIPAGRIGNDRPIEVIDERWESPALKVLVQSRHSDPRTGVVEYRLTNISRAEPSHDLFLVPSDYIIVEARNDERR